MDQQQPAWFQRISKMPVIGSLAAGLGPWGFGGCAALAVVAACVGTTLVLGGLSIFGGALLDAPFASGLAFGSDPEIMTVTPTHSATATASVTPEASATPAVTPTSSAGPCTTSTNDPTGDTLNPDTGEDLGDPGADIIEVNTHCQEDRMITEVAIASADVAELEDYSFAVVIFVFDEDEQQLYRWVFQHHAGQTTKAVEDAASGQTLDWQTTFNILSVAQTSIVKFAIPLDQLPEGSPIALALKSYHMGSSDGERSSDEVQGLIWVQPVPTSQE